MAKIRIGHSVHKDITIVLEKAERVWPLEHIEQVLTSLKSTHNKLIGGSPQRFEMLSKDKQLSSLNRENWQIRNELKLISKFVTSIIDHRHSKSYYNP